MLGGRGAAGRRAVTTPARLPLPSSAGNGTFGSLRRYRNFRLYFAGQIVSFSGNFLQDAALPWLVLQLTHSAFAVGAIIFCRYGPFLVGGLYGGVIADRFDNRRVLIITQAFSMGVASLLTYVVFMGDVHLWAVYALATCTGVLLIFDNPSRHSFIYQLVDREDVPNAIALNMGLQNAARIVGPAIGGVLIATLGIGWCFAINAASFCAVLAALLLIRVADLFPVKRSEIAQSLLVAVKEALEFLRTTRELRVIMAVSAVFGFFGFSVTRTLLPVLASQTLHGGAELFGLLAATYGLGAVAGAILTAAIRRARRRHLFAAGLAFTAPMFLLAFVRLPLVAGALLFVIGVGWSTWSSQAMARVQLAAPDRLRGRLISLYIYTLLATAPFGALVCGWLGGAGGTELAFAVAGGIGLAAVVLGGLRLRREADPVATPAMVAEIPGA